MFTFFHGLELLCGIGCAIAGAQLGHHWFGVAGGGAGIAMGYLAGAFLGRLPFGLSMLWLRYNLRTSSTRSLRERLETEPYISHLIILELLKRGDPIESFGPYISRLSSSKEPHHRYIGERLANIWPEALQPSDAPSPPPH